MADAGQNTISVDIGGTYTDCYVVWRGKAASNKALTTHHNLSMGFMRAIEGCARSFGLSLEELLAETDLVRYATTVAMNSLLTRSGPKLGLITTAGMDDVIYIGNGAQHSDALPVELKRQYRVLKRPEPLIPPEMVVTLRERIDYAGKVLLPLKREEVVQKTQYLVDQGATGFVVGLIYSYVNPVHEQMVKAIIKEEYPDIYLGSQPVFLSSEVLPKKGEYRRFMTTILTAYLHRGMAEELTNLSDELKDRGYRKPLYLVHNSGGMAPLYETTSVKTYSAGPVGGLIGTQFLGKASGAQNLIATDMGGTSFDIGLVADGEVKAYGRIPLIDWWRVGISMIETKSIGAGGGSIARVNADLGNILEVGPASAGSMPGPACFDFGGEEPTVTDADVVLGYIDPDYYLGGRVQLNKEKAVRVIEEKIAKPLNLSAEQAAFAIKRVIDGNMGNEIFKEVHLKGYDPREFDLVAFGGGGAAHCCGYGEFVGASRIIIPATASVFSAFGISAMDLVQLYETSKLVRLSDPVKGGYLADYDQFNAPVRELQEKAIKDMAKADHSPDAITFSLELEMRYGMQPHTTTVFSPRVLLQSVADVKALEDAFVKAYNLTYSMASAYPQGGIEVLSFTLRATVPVSKPEFPKFESKGATPPANALKSTRMAYWGGDGFERTDVYHAEALECGNIVRGPAIIEAVDTTIVLPPGSTLGVDERLNRVVTRQETKPENDEHLNVFAGKQA
ncbi:MAG: hydantoinase/oxoprolinase family protein [Chloroflexota bacterium]|nr:MAG: hydantoinase/oxoprolinase family protein [Chloroflexota bacterium]